MITTKRIITCFVDLFFLWVLFKFGLGGCESAILLTKTFAPLSWLLLGGVVFLLFFRSDYQMDVPIFFTGLLLGYWGEWWGTTRGVWWYWNSAMPPDYLPPLWGLGVLTVYRLSQLLMPRMPSDLSRNQVIILGSSFMLLPVLAIARSIDVLATLDWSSWLDFHFFAGLIIGLLLIIYQFDLRRDVLIYLCGTLLGGLYEYLGTSVGEWTYASGETPPLWIAPLWGLAAVAMVSLAEILRKFTRNSWSRIKKWQKLRF